MKRLLLAALLLGLVATTGEAQYRSKYKGAKIDSLLDRAALAITGAANAAGSGVAIYKTEQDTFLIFKRLLAGSNVVLEDDGNEITINAGDVGGAGVKGVGSAGYFAIWVAGDSISYGSLSLVGDSALVWLTDNDDYPIFRIEGKNGYWGTVGITSGGELEFQDDLGSYTLAELADTGAGAPGTVKGAGTAGVIPVWVDTDSIDESMISQEGSGVLLIEENLWYPKIILKETSTGDSAYITHDLNFDLIFYDEAVGEKRLKQLDQTFVIGDTRINISETADGDSVTFSLQNVPVYGGTEAGRICYFVTQDSITTTGIQYVTDEDFSQYLRFFIDPAMGKEARIVWEHEQSEDTAAIWFGSTGDLYFRDGQAGLRTLSSLIDTGGVGDTTFQWKLFGDVFQKDSLVFTDTMAISWIRIGSNLYAEIDTAIMATKWYVDQTVIDDSSANLSAPGSQYDVLVNEVDNESRFRSLSEGPNINLTSNDTAIVIEVTGIAVTGDEILDSLENAARTVTKVWTFDTQVVIDSLSSSQGFRLISDGIPEFWDSSNASFSAYKWFGPKDKSEYFYLYIYGDSVYQSASQWMKLMAADSLVLDVGSGSGEQRIVARDTLMVREAIISDGAMVFWDEVSDPSLYYWYGPGGVGDYFSVQLDGDTVELWSAEVMLVNVADKVIFRDDVHVSRSEPGDWGIVGAFVENSAAKDTNQVASLIMRLSDNTQGDFYIRHRQLSINDNDSRFELVAPDASVPLIIERTGDATFIDSVTAGYFVGDGSGLTGLEAPDIADASVSDEEFERLDGVTADIQGQIDALPTFTEMRAEISDSVLAIEEGAGENLGYINATEDSLLRVSLANYFNFTGGVLTIDTSSVFATQYWVNNTFVGSANITTLGTIGTGTWEGDAVADGYIASAATWNAKFGAGDTTSGVLATRYWAENTFVGSANITTLGTIGTGTWEGDAVADGYISSATTWNAKFDGDDTTSGVLATRYWTINTFPGSANITTLGTIGTGTWEADAIAAAYIGAHASAHITGGGDIIANFTASASGLVPLSGGGTTNFLRADGTWAPPGGTAENTDSVAHIYHDSTDKADGTMWVYDAATGDMKMRASTEDSTGTDRIAYKVAGGHFIGLFPGTNLTVDGDGNDPDTLNATGGGTMTRTAIIDSLNWFADAMDSGAVPSKTVDQSTNLQKVIDGAKYGTGIIFPPDTFYFGPLNNKSGVYLILNGTTLLMEEDHGAQWDNWLDWNDVENSGILGWGNIDGNREAWSSKGDGYGRGINIRGTSKNLYFENLNMHHFAEDGFYIGEMNGDTPENIHLVRIRIDSAYRNGFTISSGRNIYVDGIVASNTNGATPEAGIDIEPNVAADTVQNIVINNAVTYGNNKHGVWVTMFDDLSHDVQYGVTFNHLHSYNNGWWGFYVGKAYGVTLNSARIHNNASGGILVDDDVRFFHVENFEIYDNDEAGILVYQSDQDSTSEWLTFNDGKVWDNNKDSVYDLDERYHAAAIFLDVSGDSLKNFILDNVHIFNRDTATDQDDSTRQQRGVMVDGTNDKIGPIMFRGTIQDMVTEQTNGLRSIDRFTYMDQPLAEVKESFTVMIDSTTLVTDSDYRAILNLSLPADFTIDTVYAVGVGGTLDVEFQLYEGTDVSAAGTAVFSASQGCTSEATPTVYSTFSNGVIEKSNALWARCTTVTSACDWHFVITVEGHY
jgi:hypothetical protein